MKEQKSKKSPAFNMQEAWKGLDPQNQEIVTNFFNAHNLAHLLYSLASEDAKKYITSCIMMQQKVNKEEKQEV